MNAGQLMCPIKELPKDVKRALWKGKEEYIGIDTFFDQVRSQNYKVHMRILYARYRGITDAQNVRDIVFEKMHSMYE